MMHLVTNFNRSFSRYKCFFRCYSNGKQAHNEKSYNNRFGFIRDTQENKLCFSVFVGIKRSSLVGCFIVRVGMGNNLSVREIVVMSVD